MSESFHIGKRLRKELFIKSMLSPAGIGFLILLSIGIGYLVFTENYLIIVGLIGVIAASILLHIIIFKPLTGFYIITLLASFAFYPARMLQMELGISTVVEVLVWFSLLGSLIERPPKGIKNNLISSPITVMFIIYTVYHILQYFNPELIVKKQYFFVMRRFFMFFWIYIIAYRLINTPEKIKFFIKFWIFLGFLAAAYGCYQQWFGYLPFELAYIHRDPHIYGLIFQGGQFRKFSWLSDVAQFGIFSGSMCVLTLILALNQPDKLKKRVLLFGALIMALGMSYSGTRTATFTIPTGMSLYLLMTIRNKATLITIFSSILITLFILFAPIHSNKTLNRLRSSFETDDASLNVRDVNRHSIQPYLRAHPLGGGLATTGPGGESVDPSHYLAGFPPDSGLLQIGLEIGWIGLLLTVLWYLLIMYYFIYTAFRIRNSQFKLFTIALGCSILSIMVAQYSQAAIGQAPMVIFYFAAIAIVKRLLEFERLNLYQR